MEYSKWIGDQLVNKFPSSYEFWMFITVFKKPTSGPRPHPHASTLSSIISFKSTLVLWMSRSSNWLHLSNNPAKILDVFLIFLSVLRVPPLICYANDIWRIVQIMSLLTVQHYLSSVTSSRTYSDWILPSCRETQSHPYARKATGRIVLMLILRGWDKPFLRNVNVGILRYTFLNNYNSTALKSHT
jgi:hypothetical protein